MSQFVCMRNAHVLLILFQIQYRTKRSKPNERVLNFINAPKEYYGFKSDIPSMAKDEKFQINLQITVTITTCDFGISNMM